MKTAQQQGLSTKTAVRLLCLALAMVLVSCIGASALQTDFGKVRVTSFSIPTGGGKWIAGDLFLPAGASAENQVPLVITCPGYLNNREMQDLNYVEYARRGFVVISISMYGHGDSEKLPNNTWWEDQNNANGLYDAVKYLSRLPFVDASRIGVTGHSNGAQASREAVLQDDEGLIAACLLVSNDAVYTVEDTKIAVYGSRRMYDPSKDTY